MVTDNNFVHRVFAGIDNESSEYKLAPKEVFTTPKLALTYSGEGLGKMTRSYQNFTGSISIRSLTIIRNVPS